MKSKFSLIYNLVIFFVGVLFIVLWANDMKVFELVSQGLGITFVVLGSLAMTAFFVRRSNEKEAQLKQSLWALVPQVASLILGLALIFAAGAFADAFSLFFSLLLIVAAVMKFWILFAARRVVALPWWLFVMPVLVMVCGIVLLAMGLDKVGILLSLIVGIVFVVYSVHSLVEYLIYSSLEKTIKASSTDVDNASIIDIKS